MRLFALLAGLIVTASVSFASNSAVGGPQKRYKLDFEFERHGKSVCKSQMVADAGTWYVVCGLNTSQNPITQMRLHITTVAESPTQSQVRTVFEEIDPATGEIKIISNGMIAVLDGETSSMSQGEYDDQGRVIPVLSFEVTVHPL